MFLAFGLLAALHERASSGKGQVVDASMVGGTAYLMAPFYARTSAGLWRDERGANILDGAAPWYSTYATKDGRYVAVGAIEQRFYDELLRKLGMADDELPDRHDPAHWPELRQRFARVFATRTREEWTDVFQGSDACVAPVLSIAEAPRHAHAMARGLFMERNGVSQPAPEPRFDRTPGQIGDVQPRDLAAVLARWGLERTQIADLASGAD